MFKKNSFFGKLFGGTSGGCDCGMKIAEERKPQKGGCCDMRIVEEPEQDECCGCGEIDRNENKAEIE